MDRLASVEDLDVAGRSIHWMLAASNTGRASPFLLEGAATGTYAQSFRSIY